MKRPSRQTISAGTALIALVALLLSTTASGHVASIPHARAAHTLNVNDEAHLHLLNASGSTYIEQGQATGALPATITVNFNIGATISGTFTIYPHSGGSIKGHGSAQLRSTGLYSSFGGTIAVNGGTGRYTHASGHGDFYGTVNRRNNDIVIQTTGQLKY